MKIDITSLQGRIKNLLNGEDQEQYYHLINKANTLGSRAELFIEQGKEEILQDVKDGLIPVYIRDFARLHEFTDANKYGGFLNENYVRTDDYIMEMIVHDKLHEWMQSDDYKPEPPPHVPDPMAGVKVRVTEDKVHRKNYMGDYTDEEEESYLGEIVEQQDDGYFIIKNLRTGKEYLEHIDRFLSVFIHVNQGEREGRIIVVDTKNCLLLEYTMPISGTTFLRITDFYTHIDPWGKIVCLGNNRSLGASLSYRELLKSKKWMELIKIGGTHIEANPYMHKDLQNELIELRGINY